MDKNREMIEIDDAGNYTLKVAGIIHLPGEKSPPVFSDKIQAIKVLGRYVRANAIPAEEINQCIEDIEFLPLSRKHVNTSQARLLRNRYTRLKKILLSFVVNQNKIKFYLDEEKLIIYERPQWT